jgi:hypothetical protein
VFETFCKWGNITGLLQLPRIAFDPPYIMRLSIRRHSTV